MTTAHPKVQPAIDPLTTRISLLESKLARALADYANLEKRFEKDSASIVKFANSSLLAKLLDIRDHLESASVHLKDQSLTMILSALDNILAGEGVVEIKADGIYDPALMECHETARGEKDQILSVSRRGYLLSGKLLRPARVIVGNGQVNTNKQEETV